MAQVMQRGDVAPVPGEACLAKPDWITYALLEDLRLVKAASARKGAQLPEAMRQGMPARQLHALERELVVLKEMTREATTRLLADLRSEPARTQRPAAATWK